MSEPWKPHNYQKRALKFALEHPNAGLFLEPGMGKTSVAYAWMRVLRNQGLFKGAVVVAPRRPAVSVWPQEQQRWAEFADLDVVVLHGAGKDIDVEIKHDVYVVTFPGLLWLIRSGHLTRMLRAGWVDSMVIDELTKFKHISTKTFKETEPYIRRFKRKLGLTGSPAANGLINLFGQAYVLDAGKALGIYETHFRYNFFMPANPQAEYPVLVPKPGAKELIFARMKELAISMNAADYLELPQLVPDVRKIELGPAERRAYDTMERDLFAELADMELVTAVTAAASSMKCRQLTSGAIYRDKVDPITGEPRKGKREWRAVHDLKVEATLELIEELQGEQLLIGYEFGHERERLLQALGPATHCIGGGTSDKRALEAERAWNAGEATVLLGHPASMGHGLNFQRSHAHHVLWFSGTWDFELCDQFIKRLLRQGNKAERLFVHYLVCEDTIDEAVVASNKNKKRTQDEFLNALNTYRQKKGVASKSRRAA